METAPQTRYWKRWQSWFPPSVGNGLVLRLNWLKPSKREALTKYMNVKPGRLLEEYHVGYENKARHSGCRVKLTYMLVES